MKLPYPHLKNEWLTDTHKRSDKPTGLNTKCRYKMPLYAIMG